MAEPAAALRFERAEHACCKLCNPVALADFERPCVHVRVNQLGGSTGLYLCFECIARMMRTRTGSVIVAPLEPEVVQLLRDLMLCERRG